MGTEGIKLSFGVFFFLMLWSTLWPPGSFDSPYLIFALPASPAVPTLPRASKELGSPHLQRRKDRRNHRRLVYN